MKILIVDDEHLIRWFLERALRKTGHEVISAANVADASEKLDTESLDMVFVDLRIPGADGSDLIQKAQSLARRPRIVVCSAFVTEELEEEFRNRGICILKKPFRLDELYEAVRICIDRSDRQ